MSSDRFIRSIFISLAIHLLLVGTVWLVQQLQPPRPVLQNIEVEFIPPPPSKTATLDKVKKRVEIEGQQMVDQMETPLNDEIPNDTKYRSAHNQKVKKETVAKNHGEFKNIQKSAPQPGEKNLGRVESQKVAESTEKTPEEKKAFDPLADMDRQFKKRQIENIGKNPEERPVEKPTGGDVSQTQDYLKNVDQGFETLLNTKEYKYYTYFSRIRRQLSQHWEPKVRDRLNKLFRQGRRIASDQDKITKLLITLNPLGHLVKVQILSDSGVRDLDEAAIDAFRSAAPFPNPPKGIVDPDGTVKIRWDFILES